MLNEIQCCLGSSPDRPGGHLANDMAGFETGRILEFLWCGMGIIFIGDRGIDRQEAFRPMDIVIVGGGGVIDRISRVFGVDLDIEMEDRCGGISSMLGGESQIILPAAPLAGCAEIRGWIVIKGIDQHHLFRATASRGRVLFFRGIQLEPFGSILPEDELTEVESQIQEFSGPAGISQNQAGLEICAILAGMTIAGL